MDFIKQFLLVFLIGGCAFYLLLFIIMNWSSIVNFFKRSCPSCEVGNLYNSDCHLTKNNVQLEIYECDNCGETFI